jgi:hypothetical protein
MRNPGSASSQELNLTRINMHGMGNNRLLSEDAVLIKSIHYPQP